MTDHDDPWIAGNIDIDRVIIDPDYRRVVIAMLRQTRSRREPETTAPRPTEMPPAESS
jgi:hypothetical protein